MRRVNNLADVQIVLNGLLNKQTQQDTSAGNGKGRQIKNVGAGTEPDDVVTVAQLHSAVQAAVVAPVPATIVPAAPVSTNYTGRAILPGIQVVANDVLANRYHIKMPRDNSGATIFTKITLQTLTITAKIVATVSVYTVLMLVSTDSGMTFKPIFSAAGLSLPVLAETITITPGWLIPTLMDDNQIRVDVLAADGVVSGAELVLQGIYS